MRLAVATRSMNELLYSVSGELLGLDRVCAGQDIRHSRHRLTGTDSFGYFRELLRLDADWVLNLDEDAFVLDPGRLLGLVRAMEQGGYAACGMPDGGVVRIRHHNPAACNAYFNVFDLRRVRRVWKDWDRVAAATHRPEYERVVPAFARRTDFAFDHFERYYGAFFSLLDAGERILYLDAGEWEDSVSTLLHDASGEPLLIHCWYTRNWESSYHTRQRYQAVIDHVRQTQGLDAPPQGTVDTTRPAKGTAESNLGKWEALYRNAGDRQPYGDPHTYERAAQFLGGLSTVEDWGCGWAWFRKHLKETVRYKGVDGSWSPFADVAADLTRYTSRVEGILLRHVLEHNPDWEAVLVNALNSFTRRMVLVLFTPFAETTRVIAYSDTLGVPDLSFAKADLVRHFTGVRWTLEENLRTRTQYGVEHVFYLEKDPSDRPPAAPATTRSPTLAQEAATTRRDQPVETTLPALGCVLAIRDRPPDYLERTLQTYAYQSVRPADKVLLDYGSAAGAGAAYRELCRRYGWRYVAAPDPPEWWLSDAYNRAVAALSPGVEVVFKSDVDVLLGDGVLAAAEIGRERLCLFSRMFTTEEGASYPARFDSAGDVARLLKATPPPAPMDSEGVHAYPRRWFEEVGGYDLAYRGWGFEDSDLRLRAEWSIDITRVTSTFLLHQGHPRGCPDPRSALNRAYYEKSKAARQVVRNRAGVSAGPGPIPASSQDG